MAGIVFDQYADRYDAWFLENRNVLASEVRLVQIALGDPGEALSVGCGSGLFESILREAGVIVRHGVEPAEPMAEIARKRGLDVVSGSAEAIPHPDGRFDTVLLNGIPAYLADLGKALREANRVLRPGGKIVVADVPASGSYGMLYQLAARIGSWDDPQLKKIAPAKPYPIEFVGAANWRATEEILAGLEAAGFVDVQTLQTLLTHPKYSNDLVQEPVPGHDRGDYVAAIARKPRA
ncbi:MAG: methyltransferase domain-containing protein [Candidatus Eisenbacteria bacterium]